MPTWPIFWIAISCTLGEEFGLNATSSQEKPLELKAIDIHVHPQTAVMLEAAGPRAAQMARYFGRERKETPWEVMADMFRERQMMAVLMNSTDEWSSGRKAPPNDHLAEAQKKFPDLTIIGAHPSWPWQDEALAVCRHKTNYYIDLSGWAPQYFPPQLVHYASTLLQDRVLFGTDWPMIDVDRYLKEFAELPFTPEVRQKIMLDNAKKLLGLS